MKAKAAVEQRDRSLGRLLEAPPTADSAHDDLSLAEEAAKGKVRPVNTCECECESQRAHEGLRRSHSGSRHY